MPRLTPEQAEERAQRMAEAARARRAAEKAIAGPPSDQNGSRLPNYVQPGPDGGVPPCPDPLDPESIKLLFGAYFRREWTMAHSPLSGQDVHGGFNAARLAAGIGKKDEATPDAPIPMASLLGGGSKVKRATQGGAARALPVEGEDEVK